MSNAQDTAIRSLIRLTLIPKNYMCPVRYDVYFYASEGIVAVLLFLFS